MITRALKSSLTRSFPWVTGAVGLTTMIPAAMHLVEVTRMAYSERDGYDARLATMLWIGWTSLVCGTVMVASTNGLRNGSRTAFRASTGAAAVFLICTIFIVPVSPSFITGVPLYGGYLLLARLSRSAVGAAPSARARPSALARRRNAV